MSKVLAIFVLTVAVAFSPTGGAPAVAQEDIQKPNVVLILADDMRADDLQHMPQTRQLLARQGFAFPNAFVTHSLCCPSRASILRGQYTHNHQVINNTMSEGGFQRFRDERHENSTVATWLKDGGYQTVLLGKYLNHYGVDDPRHVPTGWDEWYGKVDGLPGDGEYYDYHLNENGTLISYGSDSKDYYTDVLSNQADDYVRRAAGDPRPFFMYVAPATPHAPFTPAPRHQNEYPDARAPRPPSFDERDVSDKPAWVRDMPQLDKVGAIERSDEAYRARLRMLLSLDEMVASLIEKLRVTGELENTYVFFTSDNGYHLGEHRLDKGKRTPYEEAIKVPLVVRGPGTSAGGSAEQMALNIDLAPTIAELAGVPIPTFVDGRSLASLLGGAPPAASWRSAFLIEHWSGGNVDFNEAPTYAGVRTETDKYVEHATRDKELYSLDSDPYELKSRHRSAAPKLTSLQTRLEALKACAGESCRTAEDGP